MLARYLLDMNNVFGECRKSFEEEKPRHFRGRRFVLSRRIHQEFQHPFQACLESRVFFEFVSRAANS